MLYKEKGYAFVASFVEKEIINSSFTNNIKESDYKSKLFELAHKRKIDIKYNVVKISGPDHNRQFTVSLCLDGVKKTEEKASTIKEAEQKNAKKTYKSYFSKI